MGDASTLLGEHRGEATLVQPVAPFEPGGLDALATLLAAAAVNRVAVNIDLQHVFRQPALLARIVQRFKDAPALYGW